jgi:hypothetical protein
VKIDFRLIIIDKQIKDGPAHCDYRGRCIDTIGIGPAAKFLDLDSGFAFDQIEKISRRGCQSIDLNGRLWSNHRLRSIGEANYQPTIPPGNYRISASKLIVDPERDRLEPRLIIRASLNLDLTIDCQNSDAERVLGTTG